MLHPYKKIDQRALDSLTNLNTMELKGVSREEARMIIEYWAANGLVRERLVDSWIAEHWALAGNGILGEMERAVVRMKL